MPQYGILRTFDCYPPGGAYPVDLLDGRLHTWLPYVDGYLGPHRYGVLHATHITGVANSRVLIHPST